MGRAAEHEHGVVVGDAEDRGRTQLDALRAQITAGHVVGEPAGGVELVRHESAVGTGHVVS